MCIAFFALVFMICVCAFHKNMQAGPFLTCQLIVLLRKYYVDGIVLSNEITYFTFLIPTTSIKEKIVDEHDLTAK